MHKVKVTAAEISKDKRSIKLTTNEGVKFLNAVGGCCSESWFEHVSLPKLPFVVALKGLSEYSANADSVTKIKDAWDKDTLKQYSYILRTDRGYFDVELRNKSNGFYDGGVELSDAPPKDAQFSPLVDF
jgi:hypothetical protein